LSGVPVNAGVGRKEHGQLKVARQKKSSHGEPRDCKIKGKKVKGALVKPTRGSQFKEEKPGLPKEIGERQHGQCQGRDPSAKLRYRIR